MVNILYLRILELKSSDLIWGCEVSTKIFRAEEEHTARLDPNDKLKPDDRRKEFQRDRDRILYSKEFRRLSGKTQVFIAGFDDNMRTRLTHTLEVAQIADTIARKFELNEMLVEAIAYGHDVGHAPFGHVGEQSLNLIMNGCTDIHGTNKYLSDDEKGFKHNLQGYRTVSHLEELYGGKYGLNLTRFTLWGILNHTRKAYGQCNYYDRDADKCILNQHKGAVCNSQGKFSLGYYKQKDIVDKRDWTFEAIIVAAADEIAQRHHDVEDGIYAEVIGSKDLFIEFENIFVNDLSDQHSRLIKKIKELTNEKSIIIPHASKLIVDFYESQYVKFLTEKFKYIREEFNIKDSKDFYLKKSDIYDTLVKDSEEKQIVDAMGIKTAIPKDKRFIGFLYDKVLLSELAQSMDGKSDFIIRQLFKAYLNNPQQLPDKTIRTIWRAYKAKGENGARC